MLRLIRIVLLFFCLFTLGFSPKETIIEAKTNKKQVKTGKVFQYTAKIEGVFIKPEFDLPKFKNFKIIGKQQSKSYSRKDKSTKLTIIFKYSLLAEEPGEFTIEPIVLKDSNKKYKSESIVIEVIGKPLKTRKKLLPYIEKGKNI